MAKTWGNLKMYTIRIHGRIVDTVAWAGRAATLRKRIAKQYMTPIASVKLTAKAIPKLDWGR